MNATENFVMNAEGALFALQAIECISKIMDICDEYDDEDCKVKRRKMYVKSEDVELKVLKDVAWKSDECDDSFCALNMENFNELCRILSSKVDKSSLKVPNLSFRMRVAVTLRFLITGHSHRLLEKVSLVSRNSTQRLVPQMVRYLADILEKDYLKTSKTQMDWFNEEKDFLKFWDFPHTLGVLDIRNFRIKSPQTESASKSIILLSILDAHSRFKYIEIIESDENNYHTAYINSQFYKSLKNKKWNIPSPKPLDGQNEKTPYFFVGDEIIGSDQFVLNAYEESSTTTRSQKAFNYRIKKVRFAVQMAFEIIFYRFNIFKRLYEMTSLDKAKLIIKTCCLLHNYLTQKLTQPFDYNDELTKSEMAFLEPPLPKQMMHNSNGIENPTRDRVCQYCVNEGNIAEQWQHIIK